MTKDEGATDSGARSDVAGDVVGDVVGDATPLLPEAVRAVPYSWDTGFGWPPETPESAENLALARAVLEACLPARPLAVPEPPAEVRAKDLGEGEELPDWVEARSVLRDLMPYARDVTRERMAEAEARCARAGLDTTDFTARWTLRISAWIAEEVLRWCGLMVDDTTALTPWAVELAERYATRGVAAEQAVWLLRLTPELPSGQAALARLARDATLPAEVRELAAEGVG